MNVKEAAEKIHERVNCGDGECYYAYEDCTFCKEIIQQVIDAESMKKDKRIEELEKELRKARGIPWEKSEG